MAALSIPPGYRIERFCVRCINPHTEKGTSFITSDPFETLCPNCKKIVANNHNGSWAKRWGIKS